MISLIVFLFPLVVVAAGVEETNMELSELSPRILNTTVPHKDCGSPFAYLTRLDIIPPCERDVCILTRGKSVTLLANFVPTINTKELSINVFQTDWFLNLDTVLWRNKNVCHQWNVTCPGEIDKTEYAVFTAKLPETMPMLRLKLKVVLLGDGEKQMLCESVPLDIR